MKAKVCDIYQYIDNLAPFSTAMDFDNSGLLVGDLETELTGTILALDATPEVLEFAKSQRANLIITHHPVIFQPLKRVERGSLIWRLVEEGISVISAHTNLDAAKGGLNDMVCQKLGIHRPKGFHPVSVHPQTGEPVYLGRIGEFSSSLNPARLAQLVKLSLDCQTVGLVAGSHVIKKAAVCSGAGGDLLCSAVQAGAQALITSEIKHHVALDAKRTGITLIDAGHYHSEHLFAENLAVGLREAFPQERFMVCPTEPPIQQI